MELNEDYYKQVLEGKISQAHGEGHLKGVSDERERIIKQLESYLWLTGFSERVEGAEPNEQWTLGYQAALALIKGENK